MEIIDGTPKDIAVVYIIVLSACLLLYPFSLLVVNAIRGMKR